MAYPRSSPGPTPQSQNQLLIRSPRYLSALHFMSTFVRCRQKMEVNHTSTAAALSPAQEQQASGQSIFWALAAIVISATLQPSFVGYNWSGNTFEGYFWPHRCSPFICLVDGAADLWICIKRFRNRHIPSEDHGTSNPTAVSARLAIFAIGVLPQALKLFSMKGIPLSQALAGVFLLSTILSLVRTLRSNNPQVDTVKLVDNIKASENGRLTCTAISAACWAMHLASLYLIFYWMADKVGIRGSKDTINTIRWVCDIAVLLIIVYILQHMIFMLLGLKPRIPRYPILIILSLTGMFSLPDILACPCKANMSHSKRRSVAVRFLLTGIVLSCFVAYLLQCLAIWILEIGQKGNSSADQTPDQPLNSQPSTEQISLHRVQHSRRPGDRDTSSTHLEEDEVDPPPPYTNESGDRIIAQDVSEASESQSQDTGTATDISRAPSVDLASGNVLMTEEEGSHPPALINNNQTTSATDPLESNSTETSLVAHPDVLRVSDVGQGSCSVPATENNSLGPSSGNNSPASADDDGPGGLRGLWSNFVVWVFVGLGIPVLTICMYAGLFPVKDKDEDAARQDEAERGTVGFRSEEDEIITDEDDIPAWRAKVWDFLVIVNIPGRFMARIILKVLFRLTVAYSSLYWYTFNWILWKMKSQSKDTLMVAFAVANLATAVMYYLVLFDGEGTFSPSWTSFLG